MKHILARHKMRRGQSAVEFMALVAAASLLLIGFLVILQEQIGEKKFEATGLAVKEVAVSVQDEINLASEAREGYQREFSIPNTINGFEYEINITEEQVYIRTVDGNHALAFPVGAVTGDVVKGENSIRKVNGEILLNQ